MDNMWIKKPLNQAAVDDVDNFSEKKCYEKNFLREKRIRNIVHKSTEPHCPFPGRGTALSNISDPRRLPFYGITEAICQGCAGTALAALPLTDGSGCANCAKRLRGMKDPSSLETGSRSVIEFGVYRESRYTSVRRSAPSF